MTSIPVCRERSTTITSVIVRVLVLGSALALAAYLLPVLIGQQMWTWALVVALATICLFVLYSTKRFIPGKYIFPGTFFLGLFLVIPVILTVGYSFTNFGDGARGSKEQAIEAITSSSVKQLPGSPRYNLTVATKASVAKGPFEFFLVEQKTGAVYRGSSEQRLSPVTPGEVELKGRRVSGAPGYTILTPREINAVYRDLQNVAVPVDNESAIRISGVNQAFRGTKTLRYDASQDAIVNSATGETFRVGMVGTSEYFVNADGKPAFPQSWLQGVGFANYTRLFTDASIGSQFARALGWNLIFAFGSVLLTFALGLFLAIVLNDDRIRGKRVYRSFLLLPYAVPGFIALLLWANFYNRDFGLINQTLGLHIDWLGDPTWAKCAVLLTNLWMGFPYMFIVSTGALQAIPQDVREAARIDGASGLQTTLRVVTPLLLVAVAPLLISSFAYNFNNFNAIQLLTGGGPFPPGEYTRGGTDILISMVYHIAFGGSGAEFGFASAVSVALFVLTGFLAAVQFRMTRLLEDVN
ncbi:ABC transporter permease subunit [Devriesea agamarum]|uniref:ABC transporter permease subunit n=1 Tax=Devriesea agamarum TaxID=472569 RepID=UPI00071E4652|nr:ABC transporter permease subunit [Devriesea agamarum]